MLQHTMENKVYLVDITGMDEISGLCRLCLLGGGNMVSLYKDTEDFNEKTTTIFDELQRFSKAKLSTDSAYPSLICSACIDLLKVSWKIRVQMKLSQKQLMKYFNTRATTPELSPIRYEIGSKEAIERKWAIDPYLQSMKVAPVELISKNGRFSLKELIIVEEVQEEEDCYEGFLRNLGSVISARFTNKNASNKENILEDPVVNIIPLKDKENHVNCRYTSMPPNTKTCLVATSRTLMQQNLPKLPNETFLCQICGFIATKKRQLVYHMSSRHPTKKYKCDACGKCYSVKYRFEQHRSVHKNERPYLCTVCGNGFNYLSALEYHMRMHTGERRYKCTYCSKAFSMSWGLKRHLTIHTGARPHKCRYCSKGFASTGELKCHELLHTGERPHRCQVCKKGFTKSYNLKIHTLSHKGPFKCSFCRRGFLDPSILKLHYKISHGMKKGDQNRVAEENAVCKQAAEEEDREQEADQEGEGTDQEEEMLGEEEEDQQIEQEIAEEEEEEDQQIEQEIGDERVEGLC